MMRNSKILVSIVTPFFNEEDGVDVFFSAVFSEIGRLSQFEFEIVCVDDGSRDGTLAKLLEIKRQDGRLKVVELTRNFGKEAALSAGLDEARGQAVIPFDADLQDPPTLIGRLLAAWQQSNVDVVLAKRSDRTSDSVAKRMTAASYYGVHNLLSAVKIPPNVGDCRLMSRPVVDALKRLPEKQRFMKGLFAWVGFQSITVEYVRERRVTGRSKFSGWRLWNFALEGITSFSSWPLRVWTYIGMTGACATLTYALFILLRTLIYGVDVPGYASILVSILFFGSLQLVGLGVLGEYIGRIYIESKDRPAYLVRKMH